MNMLISKGGEIITSSWIADWTGRSFEPVYEAVGQDWEMAMFFFGLIVWKRYGEIARNVVLWSLSSAGGDDVIGLTYFRITVTCPCVAGTLDGLMKLSQGVPIGPRSS